MSYLHENWVKEWATDLIPRLWNCTERWRRTEKLLWRRAYKIIGQNMQWSAKDESILKQNVHKNNSAIFITLDNLKKCNFALYFETVSVYNQQPNFCSRHNTIFVTKILRHRMSKLLQEITLIIPQNVCIMTQKSCIFINF